MSVEESQVLLHGTSNVFYQKAEVPELLQQQYTETDRECLQETGGEHCQLPEGLSEAGEHLANP